MSGSVAAPTLVTTQQQAIRVRRVRMLYFKGLAPYQGALAPKGDPNAFLAGRYASPATASCARNYVIFIANGAPQGSENNDALALLSAAGGDSTPITYPTSVVKGPDQANWADEFARFMP